MRIADYRHRLTFQVISSSANVYGEPVEVWNDDVTVWGAIWPIKGREYFSAAQVQSAVTHKIVTRHILLSDGTRINSKNRIKYHDARADEDRYFLIDSVVNTDERNRNLLIYAKEEVA